MEGPGSEWGVSLVIVVTGEGRTSGYASSGVEGKTPWTRGVPGKTEPPCEGRVSVLPVPGRTPETSNPDPDSGVGSLRTCGGERGRSSDGRTLGKHVTHRPPTTEAPKG